MKASYVKAPPKSVKQGKACNPKYSGLKDSEQQDGHRPDRPSTLNAPWDFGPRTSSTSVPLTTSVPNPNLYVDITDEVAGRNGNRIPTATVPEVCIV